MSRLIVTLIIFSSILVGCKDTEQTEETNKLEQDERDVISISSELAEEEMKEEETEEEIPFQPYLMEEELNKRDVVLFETDNGKITLVGEKLIAYPDQSEVSLVIQYEGELKELVENIYNEFRIITDAGEVYERYTSRVRLGEEEEVFVEYVFQEVSGQKVERIDYKLDSYNNDGEFEKIVLEDTTETTSIPAIYNYTSVLNEPIEIKDHMKTIVFKELSYDNEGNFNVIADVTFNQDTIIEDSKAYLFEPLAKRFAERLFSEEFFEGIAKELSLTLSMEHLSQNTPYVKLYLLGSVVNLKLFSGQPFENTMELVTLNEEKLSEQLFFEDNYKIADYIDYPILKGLVDAQGTAHYDAKLVSPGRSYGIGTTYNFSEPKLITNGYSTLDLTLAVQETDTPRDIIVTFVGDDYQRENVNDLPSISGTVLKEVTIPGTGEPQQISVDLKDTKYLTIFSKSEMEYGSQRLIVTDGVLKK